MARSRRATPHRFPIDFLQQLALFGRYELDPHGSGVDGNEVTHTCIIPFVDMIQADEAEQESFLRDLHALVAGDQGGFATYGAARLAWQLFSDKALQLPAALPLIDAGIAFKLARGVPPGMILTGYEMQRFHWWLDQHHNLPS